MRSFVVAALLLIVTPALAEECSYISNEGERLRFLDDGENTVVFEHANGTKDHCVWLRSDEGTGQKISCPGGVEDFYSVAGDEPGAVNRTLMSFLDRVWYRRCYEPT